MEKLKKRGINIEIVTTDLFSEAYSKMTKKQQTYLYESIGKIIEKYIKGVQRGQIESLIDNYILTDIKYRGRQTISKINDGFQTAYLETIENIDTKEQEQLLRMYADKIKVPLRRNQIDWLPEVIEQFVEQLRRKIELFLVPFRNISNTDLNQLMADIEKETRKILKEYQSQFDRGYKTLLNEFLAENLRQINSLIEKQCLMNQRASGLETYFAIAELSNHELTKENDHLYAENKSTKEKVELIKKGHLLSSPDGRIRYNIDIENERLGFYDAKTKVSILVHNGLITVISEEQQQEKSIVSFAKKGHNYQMYHNLKPVNDAENLKFIIAQIRKYAEGIYNKLISDPDFKKILGSIEESETPQVPNNNAHMKH